jgi:hypothetical protein
MGGGLCGESGHKEEDKERSGVVLECLQWREESCSESSDLREVGRLGDEV